MTASNRIAGVGLVMAAVLLLDPASAVAQRKGASAKITVGTVVGKERVQLQSNAAKGALVGGVLGYQTGSGKSSSRKWRNAAVGAAAMGAATRAGEGDLTGMMYTVRLGDGSVMKVITDQTEIVQGDCVTVEQVGDSANVRRADPTMCQPASQQVVQELSGELEEEAYECLEAKEQMLQAETEQQLDIAMRKVKILCND
jgi:outer membrane lipoprotein SlyB